MRLVADISAYQSHNSEWTAWQPIDLAAFGRSVDACWVRWTDWSGYVRWGADPGYNHLIDTLRAQIPVGPYLYPRPGMSSPQEQIGAWYAATPAITFPPMLDPESNDGLSGAQFSQWVDVALAETTQRFQCVPWLYASKSTVDKFGWTRPSTPHRLILAEYHWGYEPFRWADRGNWMPKAYSKWNGPDLPWGVGATDAWQFTSSAEVPGMAGLIDCSWMTEDAFNASQMAPLGAGDDGFSGADRAQLQLFVDQLR